MFDSKILYYQEDPCRTDSTDENRQNMFRRIMIARVWIVGMEKISGVFREEDILSILLLNRRHWASNLIQSLCSLYRATIDRNISFWVTSVAEFSELSVEISELGGRVWNGISGVGLVAIILQLLCVFRLIEMNEAVRSTQPLVKNFSL